MAIHFNLFVIPFSAGMMILPVILLFRYFRWIRNNNADDLEKIKQSIVSRKTINAFKEVFMECLIHRKIFRVNPLLGYMHMSLAFGWFLLIVIGKLETLYYTGDLANEIYYPVFFRFFEKSPHFSMPLEILNIMMDSLLLFILSGLIIAVFKRIRSRLTGLRKATRHTIGDRLALTSLWLIFPLRLAAESLTASYTGNGSFITQPLGDFLGQYFNAKEISLYFWWLYSTALGSFLISIPFSRYMHIPTEVLLIFLRNYGIRTECNYSGYSDFELYSCSRCGICIDSCQMDKFSAPREIKGSGAQMVYFLRDLRADKLQPSLSDNCLMCGRCNEICPVSIDLTRQRLLQRNRHSGQLTADFSFIKEQNPGKTDIIYFSGCMGHLFPGITRSLGNIFKTANLKYLHLDENGSICCGRPLKLSGQFEAARQLVIKNRALILSSGATTLVTSCPICYKGFKEDYDLPLRIVHHSEFIPEIIRHKKIKLKPDCRKVAYHDPCELGRGSGIYDQPRELLKRFATLLPLNQERETSLCCGGSLGNLSVRPEERTRIQKATADYLNHHNPDIIATACPLCKTSIKLHSEKPVMDIAELVSLNLDPRKTIYKSKISAEKISQNTFI